MSKPQILNDDAYRCLRSGDAAGFARMAQHRDVFDFSNGDFRAIDLRTIDLAKVILRGAYLKDADLRGVDLRKHDLEGCSLHNAKIGGTFFPEDLSPAEIQMSMQHGTRVRAAH